MFERGGSLFRSRRTLILLGDRLLHVVRQPWGRPIAMRECPAESRPPATAQALLESALPDLQLPAAVDIVFGSAWTRMELISLPAKRISRDEERSLADGYVQRLSAQRRTGADAWVARSVRLPERLLLTAVSADLQSELVGYLARRKVRVTSIQPLLSWLSQHRQTRFKRRDGWAVLSEPGSLSIALLEAGELASLRTYRVDGESVEIAELLRRQAAATGRPVDSVEVIALASALPALPADWAANSSLRTFPN